MEDDKRLILHYGIDETLSVRYQQSQAINTSTPADVENTAHLMSAFHRWDSR